MLCHPHPFLQNSIEMRIQEHPLQGTVATVQALCSYSSECKQWPKTQYLNYMMLGSGRLQNLNFFSMYKVIAIATLWKLLNSLFVNLTRICVKKSTCWPQISRITRFKQNKNWHKFTIFAITATSINQVGLLDFSAQFMFLYELVGPLNGDGSFVSAKTTRSWQVFKLLNLNIYTRLSLGNTRCQEVILDSSKPSSSLENPYLQSNWVSCQFKDSHDSSYSKNLNDSSHIIKWSSSSCKFFKQEAET